ncbi:ZFP36 ring finger protein-like 1 [Columba livia]|uniref:ZFP36 ring finger protein-like 1 n=1 Tax=Columba livia TaxID=8932 RepID=A0A2I0MNV8_COLLI|nr:ZFP36 ring finger protein-like 1 [Columba livia]
MVTSASSPMASTSCGASPATPSTRPSSAALSIPSGSALTGRAATSSTTRRSAVLWLRGGGAAPRLQHSFSFAGFPSTAASGLLDSPTSITPPPMLSADDLLGSPTLPDCASNPFTFSSQELVSLFAPSMGVQVPSGNSATTFLFRPMSESPNMFDSPPSPQDSLSDQEGYLSSSSSSHSGSDSPILDTSRRLPIFSRLSISDD